MNNNQFKPAALLLLAAALVLTLGAQAQVAFRATYWASLDIPNGQMMTEAVLLSDGERSIFYYPEYPSSSGAISGAGGVVAWRQGDSEQRRIYSNSLDSSIVWKTNHCSSQGSAWCILTDTIGRQTPQWTLDELAQPCGDSSLCFSASTTWAGRTYDVKYMPSVSSSLGPYKFHGLPGLIYSLRSTDDKINFVLTSLQALAADDPVLAAISPPDDGKIFATLEAHHEAMIAANLSIAEEFGIRSAGDPSPDFEIERLRWTEWRDYQIAQRQGGRSPRSINKN